MATTITNTSISTDSVTAPTVNTNTLDPTQGYLVISEQNTSGEGGEIHLAGSNGNANVVIDNLNGSVRILQGANARINIDAAGRITTPTQPSFAARLSQNWSHPSGVRAIEGTWSTIHNVGGHWDNTTRRFTAPIAGTYLFTAIVGTVGGVTGVSYISAELWVNGARGNHMTGGWDSGGSSYNQNSNAFITQLSAGDYVQLGSEINISCTIQSGSHTQLRGYLLG